jgi:hypothetical protein
MGIQTFDSRQPVLLDDPRGIKPRDWIEDLGTLRQVDYVDTIGTLTIVHFRYQPGVPNLSRGITDDVGLTVWREPPRQGSTAPLEASSHAQA